MEVEKYHYHVTKINNNNNNNENWRKERKHFIFIPSGLPNSFVWPNELISSSRKVRVVKSTTCLIQRVCVCHAIKKHQFYTLSTPYIVIFKSSHNSLDFLIFFLYCTSSLSNKAQQPLIKLIIIFDLSLISIRFLKFQNSIRLVLKILNVVSI